MAPPPPPNSDDALLARLNALKQSPLTLSTAPPRAADTVTPDALRDLGVSDDTAPQVDEGQDPILDLAARFRRLNNSKNSNTGAAAAASGGGGGADGGAEEGKSLDELLRELGGEKEEWGVSRGEERDVGKLVREVRSVLPEATPTPAVKRGSGGGAGGAGPEGEGEGEDEDEEVDQEALDEQEADEYIAQVLAGLDLDAKYGGFGDDEEQEEGGAQADGGHKMSGEESPAKASVEDGGSNASGEGDDASAEPSFSLPAAPTDFPTPPPRHQGRLRQRH